MGCFRSGSASRVALLVALALALGAPTPRTGAQAPAEAPRTFKSVYGKLQSVDKSLNGVVMKSDAGERLAWRFDKAVIAEAANFKPGDPMIVIYRQLTSTEKRVTALAFPGTATTPTYLNTTGSRVVIYGGPLVGGACGLTNPGPFQAYTIPSGGMAEVTEGCWCCALHGETCVPGNRSGAGKALLVQCFK
jgi:hypothetical protein